MTEEQKNALGNPEALPSPLERVYPPPGRDGIVVYAGELEVEANSGNHRAHGQLELHLFPESWFGVHFKGSFRDLGPISLSPDRRTVALPADSSLDPPTGTTLPAETPEGSYTEIRESVPAMTVGDIDRAERLLVHYTGPLRPRFRTLEPVAGGHQGQISFTLPGWALTLARVEPSEDGDFDGVVEAYPEKPGPTDAHVDLLQSRLFAVLGLVAGREVGIGPVCGFDGDDLVVWAQWGAPRLRPGAGAAGWCPPHLVPAALPAIAAGYWAVCADPARETIVERAIEMLLAADSNEVVDVRIPVAASGLELLSWAVLRGQLGMSKKEFEGLSAGERCARLIAWAGVPTAVPTSLPSLAERLVKVGEGGWAGPEIVFNVRNKLLHPPSNPKEPQWPKPDKLVDAWQLATWYLQMAVLRLLDYGGHYWSRLRLGRMGTDTELVPWAQ